MKKIFVFSIKALMVFGLLFALACSKSDKVKLKVGKAHQGGIIAYLDETGKHGLIAAPEDQTTIAGIQWYNRTDIVTGAFGTAIGTGKSNTDKIVEKGGNSGSYAAKLCDDLVIGKYKDWFLPSKDELNELYKNKEAIGVSNAVYWSSSEGNGSSAWLQDFSYGGQYFYSNKTLTYRVRAVRAF